VHHTVVGDLLCSTQHQVGTFHEGKDFDALVIDVNVPGGPFDVFDGAWKGFCVVGGVGRVSLSVGSRVCGLRASNCGFGGCTALPVARFCSCDDI
jgi:hypothetical protein